MSFSGDLRRFSMKTTGAMIRTRRAVVIKLFSAVILDTPVGDDDGGTLRASWIASAGQGARGVVDKPDPQGSNTIGKIASAIGSPDVPVFLTNNQPYSHKIEFDGHSSVKAPAGMMRKNVIRFQRLLREALFETRR